MHNKGLPLHAVGCSSYEDVCTLLLRTCVLVCLYHGLRFVLYIHSEMRKYHTLYQYVEPAAQCTPPRLPAGAATLPLALGERNGGGSEAAAVGY